MASTFAHLTGMLDDVRPPTQLSATDVYLRRKSSRGTMGERS